jgi:CubicO group peptidase (beta-lactamase class C family)
VTLGSPRSLFAPAPAFEEPGRLDRLSQAFPQLDEVFARFIAAQGVPGMSYGVIVDGALVHTAGFGVLDVASGATPGPDTVFRIASMTKSFTAACVLMLRDDGLLGLDDPVTAHVPELATSLRYPTADSAPVTLRSLLSMSSGLVEDDPWADRLLGMDPDAFGALLAGGLGFDLPPATGYEYSNLGYTILGRVVANVSGTALRDLARSRIFEPLGMVDTTWDADRVPAGRAAVGYRVQGGSWTIEPPLPDGAFGAMAGIATTVADLSRYVAMHLSAWPPRDEADDGPLRRASLREMAVAHQAGPTFLSAGERAKAPLAYEGYGYGLVSALHPRYGRIAAHSGALPGFSSHMEWLPDCGVGIVALANRTYRPVKSAVRQGFAVLADTGGLVPRVLRPSAALLAARDGFARLYEQWDPTLASATMLDTYFLDLDDDRRAPDLVALRAEHGACLEVGDVSPAGALRGSWRMTCQRGAFDVDAMLGSSLPARVQFLVVKEVAS